MFKRYILKKISACLTAAMIVSFGFAAFADSEQVSPCSGGGAMSPVITVGGEEDTAADTVPINIFAGYFDNGGNSYTVRFSSLDVLDSVSDISFTLVFKNAEVSGGEFSDALKNDSSSITIIGKNTAVFRYGALDNEVSGKADLCLLTVKTDGTAPSAETIEFEHFSGFDKNGEPITYEPVLTVEQGAVVPELSQNAQAAYDLITALPSADSISFYDKDGKLIDVGALEAQLKEAQEAFSALTKSEQEDVDAVLEYNMENRDALENLKPVTASMQSALPVMQFSAVLEEVDGDDLLSYRFMTKVYDEIKGKVSASGLPEGSVVLEQFNKAKSTAESKSTEIEAAYAAADYEVKIESIPKQLGVIQTRSSDTYYKEYLDNLHKQADALKKDITDNYSGSYKDYMLSDLNEEIMKVEAVQKGVSALPTFTVDNVIRNMEYTVEVTRKKDAAVAAEVVVRVYNADNASKEIDSGTFAFKADETTLKAKLYATSDKYPADEDIVIKVYYKVFGAEFYVGEKKTECSLVLNSSSSSNANRRPSSGSSNSSSSTSGGTKYPVASADDDKKTEQKTDDNKLFNDIDNYEWAREAIEGLCYAGIVNGMEDGVFNPAGNVTREQFCKMVVQLFGVLEYETNTEFADVDPNAWYAPYINSAIRVGYVQGQAADYFGVGESIMRQDMATILFRAIGSQGSGAVLSFTDTDVIASYAEGAVSELVGRGIINGYEDGTFKPRGTATRAEAAKMIWGIYNLINK